MAKPKLFIVWFLNIFSELSNNIKYSQHFHWSNLRFFISIKADRRKCAKIACCCGNKIPSHSPYRAMAMARLKKSQESQYHELSVIKIRTKDVKTFSLRIPMLNIVGESGKKMQISDLER